MPAVRTTAVDVSDRAALLRLALREQPGLVVIGPEVPLAIGAVDELEGHGFRVFGPTQAAARLETSKAFAKSFMLRQAIPTAEYAICSSYDDVMGGAAAVRASGGVEGGWARRGQGRGDLRHGAGGGRDGGGAVLGTADGAA